MRLPIARAPGARSQCADAREEHREVGDADRLLVSIRLARRTDVEDRRAILHSPLPPPSHTSRTPLAHLGRTGGGTKPHYVVYV